MSRGGSILQSRKGISPLIATVLLMAFAVALGGMIMNIGFDATKGGDCERITIRVEQLCTKGDKIVLSMRNDPAGVPLVGIKLLVTESNIENSLRIKDSALQPGQQLAVEIPSAFSDQSTIGMLGIIGTNANPITCSQALIDNRPLKTCE